MTLLPDQHKQNQLDIKRENMRLFPILCQAQGPLSGRSWLTPGQVYKMSREDPELGSGMGWPLIKVRKGSGEGQMNQCWSELFKLFKYLNSKD